MDNGSRFFTEHQIRFSSARRITHCLWGTSTRLCNHRFHPQMPQRAHKADAVADCEAI